MKIGTLEVDPPVVLAPMAGVTNIAFRRLCRTYGAGLYVSEMVTARALLEGNARSLRMASFGEWGVPKGGFFAWMKLRDGIDAKQLRYTANEEAVGYVGGEAFFADGSGNDYIRLCYSNVAEADIPEAINRLARALERASG